MSINAYVFTYTMLRFGTPGNQKQRAIYANKDCRSYSVWIAFHTQSYQFVKESLTGKVGGRYDIFFSLSATNMSNACSEADLLPVEATQAVSNAIIVLGITENGDSLFCDPNTRELCTKESWSTKAKPDTAYLCITPLSYI